jgi:hypothetical protein
MIDELPANPESSRSGSAGRNGFGGRSQGTWGGSDSNPARPTKLPIIEKKGNAPVAERPFTAFEYGSLLNGMFQCIAEPHRWTGLLSP